MQLSLRARAHLYINTEVSLPAVVRKHCPSLPPSPYLSPVYLNKELLAIVDRRLPLQRTKKAKRRRNCCSCRAPGHWRMQDGRPGRQRTAAATSACVCDHANECHAHEKTQERKLHALCARTYTVCGWGAGAGGGAHTQLEPAFCHTTAANSRLFTSPPPPLPHPVI